MEKYKAYALKGTVLALLAMFSVKIISPYLIKYFSWAGSFGSVYLLPFIILFTVLLVADFILNKSLGVN